MIWAWLPEKRIAFTGQWRRHVVVKEHLGGLGGNGVELVVYRDAYALLALAHAEGAAQVHLLLQAVVGDQLLKLLDHLTGPLYVAGTTDTHCNFHDFDLLKNVVGTVSIF